MDVRRGYVTFLMEWNRVKLERINFYIDNDARHSIVLYLITQGNTLRVDLAGEGY